MEIKYIITICVIFSLPFVAGKLNLGQDDSTLPKVVVFEENETTTGSTITNITNGTLYHNLLYNLNWASSGHTINSNVVPDTDLSYDLGGSGLKWVNIWTNVVTFDDSSTITLSEDGSGGLIYSGSQFQMDSNMYPFSDATYNLGIDGSNNYAGVYTYLVGTPSTTGYFFDFSSAYGTMGQIYDSTYVNYIDFTDGTGYFTGSCEKLDGYDSTEFLLNPLTADVDADGYDITGGDLYSSNRYKIGAFATTKTTNTTATAGEILSVSFNNSGDRYDDASATNNNGQSAGTTTFSAGVSGDGAFSDGSYPNYVYFNDTSAYNVFSGKNNFTINMWINLASNPANWWEAPFIMQDTGGGASCKWAYAWETGNQAGGKLIFWIVDTGISEHYVLGNSWSPTLNTWYMVSVTKTASGNYSFFVDGQPMGSAIGDYNMCNPTVPLQIGYGEGASHTRNGGTDEVRIWDRTLSESEIAGMYSEIGDPDTGESVLVDGNGNFRTNLTVGEELIVTGDITQTSGDTKINNYYGEMYNKSDAGFEIVDLTATDTYVQIKALESGLLNGATVSNGNMTIAQSGVYKATASVSLTASASEYGLKLFVNNTGYTKCYSHVHTATGQDTSVSLDCLVRIYAGENVNLQIDDHSNPVNDPTIVSTNVNLVRIGN